MTSEETAADRTTPSLAWARRMLLQQLDALSRLAATAWRLVDPAPAAPEPVSIAALSAAARGLEKALRLQARVMWAMRLIDGLRAKLLADLQALDSGLSVRAPGEPRGFAPEPERMAGEPLQLTEKAERAERPERPERLERERFGFESRGSDAKLAEILKRPTEEVIALICRELGLPADWPRLAAQAWARESGDAPWDEPRSASACAPLPYQPRILTAPS